MPADPATPRSAMREMLAPAAALFASVSTLICCALPALLVAVGAGAVMAGLAANVPALVFLSAHKGWVFAVAGLLLVGAAAARYASRNAPCPVDPAAARLCGRMRALGGVVLWAAAAVYAVGGFFAFFAARLVL